jgi:glycosyl hydrolase family 127 (putative beta-L-arabinofuranosidase)/beta-L-arabinofuranosidase (glycosyl hydrolase family 127)
MRLAAGRALVVFVLLTLVPQNLPAGSMGPVKNRPPLATGHFNLLPLTSVKPRGWLLRQLRIQAGGLTGHLDEFWPDVGPNSGWLGGSGESWERGPYFLDGLVPLAYLLDDRRLVDKAKRWVDWTLTHQRTDGSIGPEKNRDWWPNMIVLKALTQYQEATGDKRVIPLMQRYFAYQSRAMESEPLKQWAVFRWADEAVSVLWLYNRTGDTSLLDLARKLHSQGHDWKSQFAPFLFTSKASPQQLTLDTHVVNNAMAMKTEGEWWLVSRDASDRAAVSRQLEELDRYHLLPNGVHSGDEHYAGRSPSQGTELCAVVEGMYSIENLIAIFGDAALGDRLEKMAYNPLPGTFSKDMWAHQYDQQPNQVLCTLHKRDWTNNGPDSNLFGLEPNFGCCTSNFHQGWPKFAASLWMATDDDGLAAVAYGPSEAHTTVRGRLPVSITEDTEYPFRDRIRLTVNPGQNAIFPLELRIPQWATAARITVNAKLQTDVRPGSFHRIEREWRPGDVVDITLPMNPRVSRWYQNSIAVERGPLVYSLKIGEDWKKLRDRSPAADWEVYPTTPWNYGLLLNPDRPETSIEVREKPVADYPFSSEGAPVELTAKGRRIPEWKLVNGSAAPPPPSPVRSTKPVESLTLIPYGAAKLRITAFPLLER